MSIRIVEMTKEDIEKLIAENEELNPSRPVRSDIVASLNLYAQQGVLPGSFLTAVLENNLSESLGRADSYNRATIHQIVSYVYNKLPSSCWGSPEIVQEYCARFIDNGDAS